LQSIRQWLAGLGLEQYAASFESNDVDVNVLPELTEADLHQLGVSLGHRKRILVALQAGHRAPPHPPPAVEGSAAPVESLTAEGERRQVSVLFCDLVGSTALSNRLDPEEYRKVLARYHETCIGCVQRFEGFVAQIQGDGVVAYFGYPMAHEAEAERAIRAALAIVQALAALDVGLGQPLAVRIGVASGLVVVSHVLAPDKSAVGETPNLAQRLQTLAQPGELMVSERTRALAGGAFDYADRGLHTLKGIAEPTRVWQVLGASGAASRFEAATRSGVTPMVGREQEIALLLDRWERSRAGEGQVVLLQGEPGIGKSRMLRAFRERLGERIEMSLQYQCSPYYVNSAFYPIIDHLERALRFEREDSAEQKLDKVEQRLIDELGRSRTDCHLLARAMSLPAEARYGALEMSPQRQKDETVALLVDIVAQIAGQQATVVLFEDVHWADPTTVEVLGALVGRADKLPLLVLITYRPEFEAPWTAHSHLTPIGLTRLSRAQSASIVLGVADNKPLPADLVVHIVDKTDGVPLFLEELTKAVLESDLLVEADGRYDYSGTVNKLAIPATLRDSLMARLDRLIPVKEIAQVGACLGREFSYELVRAVSPMDEAQLREALDKLTASELVFRRGTPPVATYIFKHALVQDAAYDSLLKSKRQTLHAQIAEAILERLPGKAQTEPELLAHHYTEAGMPDAAIPFWEAAGELAQGRVALQEAIGHYQRALQLICSLPPSTERDALEVHQRALLGIAWVEQQGYTHLQVEAILAPAWRLDHALHEENDAVRVLWGLWVYRLCTGEVQESLSWAERLLLRAEEIDSETMRIVGHWTACNSYFFLGEFTRCVEHANALLSRYDQVRDARIARLVNHDPKTIAFMHRAAAEWILGYPDRALATADQGIANAAQVMHPFDRCWARHFGAMYIYGPIRQLSRAEALIAEMERYAKLQRLPFFLEVLAPMKRALSLGWAGPSEGAYVARREALDQWVSAGLQITVPFVKANLAETAGRCGRWADAMALLDEALEQMATPSKGERQALAEVLRVKACALRVKGDPAASEALFRQALDIAARQQAKTWELRAATNLARMLMELGRHGEGREILAPVYRWFTEGHDTADLREAAALLTELGADVPSRRCAHAMHERQ